MIRFALLVLGALLVGLASAQTMYRWVDKDGKVHFADRPPPPGQVKDVREKSLSAPSADKSLPWALRQATENFPVVLHVVAACPACDGGRAYLRKRGIPHVEKMVSDKEAMDLLRQRLGVGELMAPVLQVGERMSMGYLESAWAGMLDAAGYPQAVD